MLYKDLDKSMQNGCKRFVEMWKDLSDDNNRVIVFEKSNMKYPAFYMYYDRDEENKPNIIINSTVIIPALSESTSVEDILENMEFNEALMTLCFNKIFKVLNNKSKFIVADKWE